MVAAGVSGLASEVRAVCAASVALKAPGLTTIETQMAAKMANVCLFILENPMPVSKKDLNAWQHQSQRIANRR